MAVFASSEFSHSLGQLRTYARDAESGRSAVLSTQSCYCFRLLTFTLLEYRASDC